MEGVPVWWPWCFTHGVTPNLPWRNYDIQLSSHLAGTLNRFYQGKGVNEQKRSEKDVRNDRIKNRTPISKSL